MSTRFRHQGRSTWKLLYSPRESVTGVWCSADFTHYSSFCNPLLLTDATTDHTPRLWYYDLVYLDLVHFGAPLEVAIVNVPQNMRRQRALDGTEDVCALFKICQRLGGPEDWSIGPGASYEA